MTDYRRTLTPPPVAIDPAEEVSRALAARDQEDRRVRHLADEQIKDHVAKCPAVRGYQRLMGVLLFVAAILAGGGAFGFWSLRNAIKVEVYEGLNALRGEVTGYVDKAVSRRWAANRGIVVPMARAGDDE